MRESMQVSTAKPRAARRVEPTELETVRISVVRLEFGRE